MLKHLRILLIALICMCPLSAYAVTCDGSADNVEIQAAINAAAPGDTVTIDAGTCDCDSAITITKALTLQGAGIGSTYFVMDGEHDIVSVAPTSDVFVRVTGIEFNSTAYSQSATANAVQVQGSMVNAYELSQIRIDHCKFNTGKRAVHIRGWVEGVADNNYFLNCNIAVGVEGDEAHTWARAIEAGTGDSFFIEDNQFVMNSSYPGGNQQIYHQEGGRSVTRYNTMDSSACTVYNTYFYDTHGNQNYYDIGNNAGTFRGQPIVEIYENTVTMYKSIRPIDFRGGSALCWNNDFVELTGSAPYIDLTEEESWSTTHFETGLDSTWPAEDQITNSYFWGNTFNGNAQAAGNFILRDEADAEFIVKDQDYFLYEPTTSGGKSTYTSRAGAAGNAADGTLTFSAVGDSAYYPYTPYTYPHPLRDEGTAQATGTLTANLTESGIVAGGDTIVITLTGAYWVATAGDDNAITTAIIAGIDSNKAEAGGWDAVVKVGLTHANVVRTSDTVLTITLPAFAGYDITESEIITGTVPGSATDNESDIVASPTVLIAAEQTGAVSQGAAYNAAGAAATYNAAGAAIVAP